MTPPPHRRLLVVDDEPLLREALGARLRRSGFDVTLAASAEEAWAFIKHQIPDAVVLDICMPGVSGFELLDRLRSRDETQLLPVVLLSALSDTEHIVHGLERGASDYVVKPPSIPLLVARLNAEIARHHHLRQAKASVHAMEHLASHDPLTGIYNRRSLHAALDFEFQRMLRYDRPLSLLMLDLDEFKGINDHYGHSVGDEILREVGERLTSARRSTDIVSRYGGEEFCVLLPETASDAALQAAENIRIAIDHQPFLTSAGPIHLTLSIGSSSAPSPTLRDSGDLLKQADQALYEAKRTGRNRVVSYRPPVVTQMVG